jgi:hypothetical protein
MPYIKQENRKHFEKLLDEAKVSFNRENDGGHNVMTEGELNYVITKLLHQYVLSKGVSYKTYNDVTGVMESAKSEFYRRYVAPYEDAKIKENGDV